MGDGPGYEFVRLLRVMAVPLEHASGGLRMGTCPIAQLARCLRVNFRPSFERDRTRRRWRQHWRRHLRRGRSWRRRCWSRVGAANGCKRDGKKTGFQSTGPLGHFCSPGWVFRKPPPFAVRMPSDGGAQIPQDPWCPLVAMIHEGGECETSASHRWPSAWRFCHTCMTHFEPQAVRDDWRRV
jgi:hypothetical protein